MDRNGKKSKAIDPAPNSQRSDLKAGQQSQFDKAATGKSGTSGGSDLAARRAAKSARGERPSK
jgi:hypothetical protein